MDVMRAAREPKVGAVMAFRPHGNSRLGHVAAVSRIVDSRTVLISHANWSPIDGRRGQIERNVEAVDVSPDNDWSSVRIWFAPIEGLGATAWPLEGFIYNRKPGGVPDAKPKLVKVARTIGEKTRLARSLSASRGRGQIRINAGSAAWWQRSYRRYHRAQRQLSRPQDWNLRLSPLARLRQDPRTTLRRGR